MHTTPHDKEDTMDKGGTMKQVEDMYGVPIREGTTVIITYYGNMRKGTVKRVNNKTVTVSLPTHPYELKRQGKKMIAFPELADYILKRMAE